MEKKRTPKSSEQATDPKEVISLSPTKKLKDPTEGKTSHQQIIEKIYAIISITGSMETDASAIQANIRERGKEDKRDFEKELTELVLNSQEYALDLNKISQLLYYCSGTISEKKTALKKVISEKKEALQAELKKLLAVISSKKNKAAADTNKQTGVKYRTFMQAYYMHQITTEELTTEDEGKEFAYQQMKHALIAWYELNKTLLEVTIKTQNIEETYLWHYVSSIATEHNRRITKDEIITSMKQCLKDGTIAGALETLTQHPFSLFDTLFPENNHQSEAQSTPAKPEASSATENRVEFPQTPKSQEEPIQDFMGTPAGEKPEENDTSPTTQLARALDLRPQLDGNYETGVSQQLNEREMVASDRNRQNELVCNEDLQFKSGVRLRVAMAFELHIPPNMTQNNLDPEVEKTIFDLKGALKCLMRPQKVESEISTAELRAGFITQNAELNANSLTIIAEKNAELIVVKAEKKAAERKAAEAEKEAALAQKKLEEISQAATKENPAAQPGTSQANEHNPASLFADPQLQTAAITAAATLAVVGIARLFSK